MSLSSSFIPSDSSKIAIPRLLQTRGEPPKKTNINRQARAARACLSCRARKIRCNGATPTCSNCSDASTPCAYATSRKDRFKTSTTQNQAMMALLRDLRAQVSRNEQERIDHILGTVSEDVADAAAVIEKFPKDHPATLLGRRNGEEQGQQGEANISAEIGNGDLLKGEQTRATSFIGKASEIQWLPRLRTDGAGNNNDGPCGSPVGADEAASERVAALRKRQGKQDRNLMHTNKASFFLDDEIFELDLEVDQYELPPFDIAEKMVQTYMHNCHDSFPFLVKKAFINKFYHYYAALRRGEPYRLPQKWQAQLNLVFAIAAVYSHLALVEWRGDERDHLIYNSRAWALSLKDPWWFSHPDLPQMQIMGLLSFYYLSIGHVNRSWVLTGMGLRFGQALGLHVRNEDRHTGAARKEELARVWWGHFALDRHLATITGRPGIGVDKSCSVPLPLPLSCSDIEDTIIESRYGDRITTLATISGTAGTSPGRTDPRLSNSAPSSFTPRLQDPVNSGSYLRALVEFSVISQNAMDLYSARTTSQSWLSVQSTIAQLIDDLEIWATALPNGFRFFDQAINNNDGYQRERNILVMLYHGTRILITRPCLCRLDRRIQNQTARSSEFNEQAAMACVDSAKCFAKLLPEDPDLNIQSLYQCGPWWSMVHAIMQSLVVLLLDISLDVDNFTHDRWDVLPPLKQLVRWLRTMSVNNRMANRAYPMIIDVLRKLFVNNSTSISDILQEDEVTKAAAAVVAISTPPLESRGRGGRQCDTTTVFPQAHSPVIPTPAVAPLRKQFHYTSQYQEVSISDACADPMVDMHPLPPDPTDLSGMPLDEDAANRAYMDIFSDTGRPSGLMFPSLLSTSFDECSPLPGFELGDLEMGCFNDNS